MKKSILIVGSFLLIAAVALVYAMRITTPQTVHSGASTSTQTHFAGSGNVDFEWKLVNPYLLKGSPGDTYLELRVTGKNAAVSRKRMNLVLVIDRSGSMGSEDKLVQVQQAATAILNQMNPTDRLAIVIYDDTIQTILPSTPVENKELIREVIASLTPGGGTNLCGGLQAGFEEARNHFDAESVNRVMLLSDGLANVGIIDPAQISAVASRIRENSVAVSSLGVGIDFNETLMANIADNSGGNYYYISRDVNMAKIFQQEWNLMQQVIATGVQARLKLGNRVDVVEVAGFTWRKENNELSVQLPDIYSGESKRVLVHLRTPAETIQTVMLGHGTLAYTDIVSGQKPVQLAFEPSIRIVEDSHLVESNVDRDVRSKQASFEASKMMKQAYAKWEEGDDEQARNLTIQATDMLNQLGDKNLQPQAYRYEQLLNSAMAPGKPMSPEAKKDVLKRQKAAERQAEQSTAQ